MSDSWSIESSTERYCSFSILLYNTFTPWSNEASELYKLNDLLYFRFKLAPSLYVWISSPNVAFSIVIDSIFPLYEHWRNKRTPRGVQGYVLSRIQCLPIQRIPSRWIDASHVPGWVQISFDIVSKLLEKNFHGIIRKNKFFILYWYY